MNQVTARPNVVPITPFRPFLEGGEDLVRVLKTEHVERVISIMDAWGAIPDSGLTLIERWLVSTPEGALAILAARMIAVINGPAGQISSKLQSIFQEIAFLRKTIFAENVRKQAALNMTAHKLTAVMLIVQLKLSKLENEKPDDKLLSQVRLILSQCSHEPWTRRLDSLIDNTCGTPASAQDTCTVSVERQQGEDFWGFLRRQMRAHKDYPVFLHSEK